MRRFGGAIPGRGDVNGGLSAALVVVPIVLSCGSVSYQTLGPEFVARGVTAAFASAVIAALAAWLFDGKLMHINSPKTSHAALLSLLMAQMAADAPFARAAAGLPGGLPAALIGVSLSALLVAGFVQFALGILRLGKLVRLLPRPVLAGLVNGFALQIILAQLPRALGGASMGDLLHQVQGGRVEPWPVLLALVSGAATVLAKPIGKTVPAPLLGLLAGTVGAAVLGLVLPHASAGPVIGTVTVDMAAFSGVASLFVAGGQATVPLAALPVLQTGVTLALVSSIQSLLNIATGDTLTGQRHDPARCLMVQGGTNIAAACVGGTPSGGSINTTQAAYASGARTRGANLAHALTLAAILLVGRGAIAAIPLAAMASVVIVTTVSSFDSWSLQLARRTALRDGGQGRARQWLDIATVALVAVLLLEEGALIAMAAGFTVTVLSFLERSVQTFVRAETFGDAERSRTSRDAASAEALRQHGRRIAILSLQGPLTFATAEAMLDRIEAAARGARFVILDMAGVTDTDITGVFALRRARGMFGKDGPVVLVAGLLPTPRMQAMLQEAGLKPSPDWRFDTLNEALCSAEDRLLRQLGLSAGEDAEIGFADILPRAAPGAAELLERHCVRRTFAAGSAIVRAGEPGGSAFFLCAGEINVLGSLDGRRAVLARYRAGTVFGEMALLTGRPRSATVEAQTAVTVQELSAAALEAIGAADPRLAAAVLRAIGEQLSGRVSDMTRTAIALGA